MRAISLTQPWATAIALGLKQWETRSWPTKYRGQIAIHASKGFPVSAKQTADDFAEYFKEPRLTRWSLMVGGIICVADLTECRRTEDVSKTLTDNELMLGDFSKGRYCFKTENVVVLPHPIICSGALGIWSVPWDPAVEVLRALKSATGVNDAT